MTTYADEPKPPGATSARRRGRGLHRRTAKAPSPGMVKVRRMSVGRSMLVALAGLVVVLAIAFGVMTGVGAVLHLLNPSRHFDVYAVLHKQIVVLCLIGLCVLWLLPPHPWAKELVEAPVRDDPAPWFPEPATGEPRVDVVAVYQGRAPPASAEPQSIPPSG